MKKNFIVVLCMILQIFSVSAHEFHVSISKIKLDKETRKLKVTIKIFTDDLENAIMNHHPAKLHLGTKQEIKESEKFIKQYIQERFSLRINGTVSKLIYINKKYELDAIWCNFITGKVDHIRNIEVQNQILTEIFDSQVNIVRFEINHQRKYINLNKLVTTDIVSF